ncbi:putative Transmembrane protein [Quillaja saponaria]|uniref:Transmembrane protein n=1 Tax=Quillaja saponaria TaxID=32244 RepID=A0AAD7L000_QUISA|nr:putative Transmembrane protein [Quillaja saponaria]
MTSLCAAVTTRPHKLILGFLHPRTRAEISSIDVIKLIPRASPTSPTFRIEGTMRLQGRGRLTIISASNSNSTGGNSPNQGINVTEETDTAQGPPLLTILAGLVLTQPKNGEREKE